MSCRHGEKSSVVDTSRLPQRLDGTERFFCYMHDRGRLLESCAVFLETSVPLSLQVLQQTAWHWANRHSRLRARIASNGDNYEDASFVEMSSLTVDDMPVQEVDHGDWKYVNETELEEKFDCLKGPLWRLRYVPGATNEFDTGGDDYEVLGDRTQSQEQTRCSDKTNGTIIFVVHHCISDGIGIANLMGEYIDILTCLLHSKPVLGVIEPVCDSLNNLLQPLSWLESLVMRLLALPFPVFSHAMMWLVKRNIPTKTSHVPLLPVGKYQKPLHRIIPLVMSEVDTASLVMNCRQRGCTVQGALQAAIGLALAQIRPGEQKTEKTASEHFKVHYAVPVSLRRRLKNTHIPDSAVGNYFGDVFPEKAFSSDLSQEALWEAALEMSNDIHSRIKANEPINMVRISMGPPSFFRRGIECIDEISNGAQNNGWNSNVVFFSNLGVCGRLDEKDPLVKPKSTLLSMGTNSFSFMFTIICVTANKRLCLTVATRRNVVSDEMADGVSQAFQQALQRFIN